MTTLARPNEVSDADLAVGARAGDMRSIEALYRRYGTDLLRLAARLTGSVQDGEDVLHDVFVGLPIALRSYSERGTLGAWLRTITSRTALMHMRSRKHWDDTPVDDVAEHAMSALSALDRITLEDAISALPTSLRIVFVLREIEHYSHAEIGAMLGIRRGTSEVRLHRAIRALRAALRSSR